MRAAKPRSTSTSPPCRGSSCACASEFHNCWSDCAANANTMQAAIQAFANQHPARRRSTPRLVLSKALTLYDGTVASGGNRYNGNVIGAVGVQDGHRLGRLRHQRRRARDQPHAVRRRHLGRRLGHQPTRRQGAGLDHEQQEAPRPDQGHGRVHDRGLGCTWQRRAGRVAHRRRIRAASTARNFTLGQTMYNYDFINRSSTTRTQNGDPKLSTLGRRRGSAGDAAARRRDLRPGGRPADLRQRRVHRGRRPGRRRNARLTGTTPSLSCSATRSRATASSRACSAWSRSTTARSRRRRSRRTSRRALARSFFLLFSVEPPGRRAAGLRHVRGQPVRQLRATCSTSRPSSASTRRPRRAASRWPASASASTVRRRTSARRTARSTPSSTIPTTARAASACPRSAPSSRSRRVPSSTSSS